MRFAWFVLVLMLPVLGGCPENATQSVPSFSAQSAVDAKRAEYDAIYEKQLRDSDAQIKKTGEQLKRHDELLDQTEKLQRRDEAMMARREEQAKRIDALIERWERITAGVEERTKAKGE